MVVFDLRLRSQQDQCANMGGLRAHDFLAKGARPGTPTTSVMVQSLFVLRVDIDHDLKTRPSPPGSHSARRSSLCRDDGLLWFVVGCKIVLARFCDVEGPALAGPAQIKLALSGPIDRGVERAVTTLEGE